MIKNKYLFRYLDDIKSDTLNLEEIIYNNLKEDQYNYVEAMEILHTIRWLISQIEKEAN